MGRCNVCTCPARLVRSLGGSDSHRDQARILTSRTMKDVNLRCEMLNWTFRRRLKIGHHGRLTLLFANLNRYIAPGSSCAVDISTPMPRRFGLLSWIGVTCALVPLVLSSPSMDAISIVTKPESKILTSRTMKDVNLRYAVDSGVCETTQGVHQMSGYIDVGKNMSMVGSRFSMQKVKTDFTLVQW
jgi:hypothetical protein